MKKLIAFLILVVSVSASRGTKIDQQPSKDPQALAVLQTALSAMGGQAGVVQVTDSVATGKMTPAEGSGLKPGTFVWKTSGTEFRYETQRDSGVEILASGHGKPAVSNADKVRPLFYHITYGALAVHLPAILAATQISDANISVAYLGTEKAQGKQTVRVQANLNTDKMIAAVSQQVWYFDAASGMPLRVEYRLPADNDMSSWTDTAMEFSDYRQVGPAAGLQFVTGATK
jgi:outer membrane lipoprotein-sorting protein